MSQKNYCISLYKALLDKDIEKIKYLYDIENEDKSAMEQYPNEHPELNYQEIFQDADPVEFFINIIKTDEELSRIVDQLTNQLATTQNLNRLEQNSIELKNYPLINYSPNPNFGAYLIENLASLTYSKIFDYATFKDAISNLVSKLPILDDIFSSISISCQSDKSFSAFLIGDNITEFTDTRPNGSTGYYSTENYLVVTNPKKQLHLLHISHEFTHKLMDLLFNNSIDPYNKKSTEEKNKYHQAIRDTLLNIKEFIKNEFNFDIKIKDSETTWEIGKKLYPILSQALESEKLELSEMQKDQLKAIETFLLVYQNYKESAEDAEFIAMFPEIIVKNLYYGKTVDILLPISEYWEEVVSPKAYEYQATHDQSNICQPLLGDNYLSFLDLKA